MSRFPIIDAVTLTGDIASEVDRLVWTIRDAVRARRADLEFGSALSPGAFNPLINLLSFRDGLSESFIRRRYIYRPENKLEAFFGELTDGEYLIAKNDGLIVSERLAAIGDEIATEMSAACRGLWSEHEGAMARASAMARTAIDAGDIRDGLLQVATSSEESSDPYRRFWQRLSALRLLRNEAHVDAWRAHGLVPSEIEALTDAWAGSLMQAPVEYSAGLGDLGYVADDIVTPAGIAARQHIEDATDAGVADAFATIDAETLLMILRSLPGAPD
ncbi:MAG: hypothetical protein ACI81L_002269 [Verrucomicrobiales bacterium]